MSMTDNELQALRNIFETLIDELNDPDKPRSGMNLAVTVEQYVPRLLAEIDRQREIVRWVADVPWYLDSSQGYNCAGCDRQGSHPATIQHHPDCPVLKARALLGGK